MRRRSLGLLPAFGHKALAEGAGDDERAARLLHGLVGQMHGAQPHSLGVSGIAGARVLQHVGDIRLRLGQGHGGVAGSRAGDGTGGHRPAAARGAPRCRAPPRL